MHRERMGLKKIVGVDKAIDELSNSCLGWIISTPFFHKSVNWKTTGCITVLFLELSVWPLFMKLLSLKIKKEGLWMTYDL